MGWTEERERENYVTILQPQGIKEIKNKLIKLVSINYQFSSRSSYIILSFFLTYVTKFIRYTLS